MDNNSQNNISKHNKTCFSPYTAGIRESRKIFNLVSQTIIPSSDAFEPHDNYLLELEILLKQTWNIWGVSIMFDFQCKDEVQLKQYAKKLREEVACILSQEDVSYEAKFKVLNIHRPRETDHPVVQIEVFAQVTGKEDKESCVYKGFFFSWRSEMIDAPSVNIVKLPLLLCRGTPNTMRAVHSTLSRMFDCIFVELPTNSDDLLWLLPILVCPYDGHNIASTHDEAMLEYLIPNLPNSNTITIKFQIKNLVNLWKSFWETKDKIKVAEVKKFHEILQKQVMEISSLQLGLCILHRINLPSVTISQAKMKVMNVETMNTLLTYLNEKALDALHLNITQLSASK